MKKVKKALLPAAGLGTRFLPVTKSVPKEMLPIVAKPILLHLAEELVSAGIEELILVVPPKGKESLLDFFSSPSADLSDALEASQRQDLLDSLEKVQASLKIRSVIQEKPMGLGHAVLTGKSAIGDEPFAVILGDELSFAPAGTTPILKNLIEVYQETSLSTVAVMSVPSSEVNKYGIIQPQDENANPMRVLSVIEKPSIEKAPSRWALPGRYVFSSEIFEHLQNRFCLMKEGDVLYNLVQTISMIFSCA